jgi:Zn-dependent protease
LFRIFGITVYIHWTWFLFLAYELQYRKYQYHEQLGWNLAEYLALFAIVLMHEFGHALACRSVGGRADTIMLWPLGGVAYVQPPERAGAVLWSLVAGPLVNLVLLPITVPFLFLARDSNFHNFLWSIGMINCVLLVFNLLPIFPLDGGQILWALLWFVVGRARGLHIATVIGLLGAAAMAIYALASQDWWLLVLAIYAGSIAFRGFSAARAMLAQQAAWTNRPPPPPPPAYGQGGL